METKEFEKMTDEEYFSIPAVSASQIKAFDKGAYWFWRQSPYNPDRIKEQPGDALIFGKLAHALLLEPSKVQDEFEVADFGKSRTNKKFAELQSQTNKILVSEDEWTHALAMKAQIAEHPLASAIINGATAEQPYFWIDAETKLYCKCKVDAIKRTKNGIVVIDYKTSSDIEGVLNWPQKLQYPLQADFYSRAVKEKYGEEPCEFIFIIQSNKVGEEDIIAVANVEYDSSIVAHDIVDHHMREIKSHLDQWQATHNKNIFAAYPTRVEMKYSNWFMERG